MTAITPVSASLYRNIFWEPDKKNANIVKVYEGVSKGEKIKVEPFVKEVLQAVQEEHLTAQRQSIYRYGKANIPSDIYQHNGASVPRYFMLREHKDTLTLMKNEKPLGTIEPGSQTHADFLTYANNIAGSHGPACRDAAVVMAATLASKLGSRHPVGIVKDTGQGKEREHVFPVVGKWKAVVGDHRVPQYGAKDGRGVVVADQWPVFPVAHTADQGRFTGESNSMLVDWQPSTTPFGFSVDNASNPISTEAANALLKEGGWVEIGEELVRDLFKQEEEDRKAGDAPSQFEQVFAVKNPAVKYRTGLLDSGESYNVADRNYFQQKQQGIQGLESYMKKHPQLFQNNKLEPLRK
jgi:hypothetical protein